MLGFKQFLTEVVGRNELKDIVFLSFSRTDAKSDDSSFMRKVLLPMSKKMSQRVLVKEIEYELLILLVRDM